MCNTHQLEILLRMIVLQLISLQMGSNKLWWIGRTLLASSSKTNVISNYWMLYCQRELEKISGLIYKYAEFTFFSKKLY